MTPNSLKVFVKNNLGPLLESSGYGKDKLNLLLMDEGLPFIKNWTDIILEDNQLHKYLSGIAIHWYYNDKLGSEVESILDYVHERHPQLFVLNSEACHLDGAGHGNWEYAERYAFDVIKVILVTNLFLLTAYPTFVTAIESLVCGVARVEYGPRYEGRSHLFRETRLRWSGSDRSRGGRGLQTAFVLRSWSSQQISFTRISENRSKH